MIDAQEDIVRRGIVIAVFVLFKQEPGHILGNQVRDVVHDLFIRRGRHVEAVCCGQQAITRYGGIGAEEYYFVGKIAAVLRSRRAVPIVLADN